MKEVKDSAPLDF